LAFKKAFLLSNIASGWQKIGLHPFNLLIMLKQLFITEMDKFKAKLFKIKVENKVFKHKNQGLKEAVKLKQRRRKGRKAIKMPNKHGGAVIRTPSKVQAIYDANIAKEQAKQQKQQKKYEKQLQK
ncbi:hypothetical protein EV356DRAFT_498287, partial [Viridothelium virens]